MAKDTFLTIPPKFGHEQLQFQVWFECNLTIKNYIFYTHRKLICFHNPNNYSSSEHVGEIDSSKPCIFVQNLLFLRGNVTNLDLKGLKYKARIRDEHVFLIRDRLSIFSKVFHFSLFLWHRRQNQGKAALFNVLKHFFN